MKAFGSFVSTSCTRIGTPSTPSSVGDPRRGGLQLAGRGAVRVGTRYGVVKRSSTWSADEHRRGRDPPEPRQQLRQPHRDQHGQAEEQELDAEREPATEDHGAVALVRLVVAALPPRGDERSNGTVTSQTSPKPSIASSIPVPIGPAADSRVKRAPRQA